MGRSPGDYGGGAVTQDGTGTHGGPLSHRKGGTLDLALYVLLGLLAAAPLWGPGIISTRGGGDSPFLIQRTLELADNLRHGVFPPRWMSHAAFDLGYPFFNHYAALPYYLSGGLTSLGLNPLAAIQITQTFGFVLAAIAMGLWSLSIFRGRAARALAVAAYTFAPFHLVNVYVRGDSLSEFFALALYPLILWALHRVARKPTLGRALTVALTYGALILTHNVSALIFSPFAAIYACAAACQHGFAPTSQASGVLRQERNRTEVNPTRTLVQSLAMCAAAAVVGVLLTAWFWLPAIGEIDLGQMGPAFTEGYFHYSNHFRGFDLVQDSVIFDYSVAATATEAGPFAMGLVQAVLALAGATATGFRWVSRRDKTKHRAGSPFPWLTVAVLAGGFLATFMVTPLSRPLWDALPLLEVTQFPWRFLSIQALFAAALAGAVAEAGQMANPALQPDTGLPDERGHTLGRFTTIATAAIGICAVAVAALAGLKPDRLLIAPEDVTWERLLLYESFTGNIGTTVRYEYLPKDVVPRLYTSEALIDGVGAVIADDGGTVDAVLRERTSSRQVWSVTTGTTRTIVLPLNWWPGWRASVDGVETEAYALVGSGRLALLLPAGTHSVEVRLKATPLARAAQAVSLTTLVVVAFAACRTRLLSTGRSLVIAGGWGWALLLVAAIGPLVLQRAPQGTATFFDFEQMPFAHRGPVTFADLQLDDVIVSPTTAGPGEPIHAKVHWRPQSGRDTTTAPYTVTLRFVSPAEARHGVEHTLARTSAPLSASTELELVLPEALSRGLYLLQLRVEGPEGDVRPRTARGRAMGDLYVGAIRVPLGKSLFPETPVLAAFRDLTLHTIEVEQPQPETLDLTLTWSTQGTPRNWRVSYRILDLAGHQLSQQDLQPGYGYLPTTLWRSGEAVTDHVRIPLPEGLAPGDYTLSIVTYLQATMEGGGEVDIPVHLAVPTLYDLRTACCEQTRKGATIVCETGGLALLGFELPDTVNEGDRLEFRAEWNALRQPEDDFQATWAVLDPAGTPVTTLAGPLAIGSRTDLWPRFTWARAPVALDLPPRLPAGVYSLTLLLKGQRAGPVDCGPVAQFAVAARPRSYSIPALPQRLEADFGATIRLLGYDVEQDRRAASLTLTLWWQAIQAPDRDLKRFVHLYDAETEVIGAQDDAMPRAWTYPTSWWTAGEVVSETVVLQLAEVAAGSYSLGIGWYDPETSVRLPIVTTNVDAVRDGRLTLRAGFHLR